MLKKPINIKEILFFLFFLFLISCLFEGGNQLLAFYPCECSEDRIIQLSDPLMEGSDVLSLQIRLEELGYYSGDIDGIYGLLSEKAVKEFQKNYILEENGIVDNETWGMLANLNRPIITSPGGKKPEGELSIIINLYSRTLTLLSDEKIYKSYPVTIGKKKTPSPVGEWYIKNKYVRVDNGPLGSRWMGIDVPWGVYGIHGTNKPWEIGTASSSGCIRLHNQYVEELFDWVEIKTPVKIIGPKPEAKIEKIPVEGSIGYDIMAIQERLREQGIYIGRLNGIYDEDLIESIKDMESQFQLKVDGIADENILKLLELEYELKLY